jgi:hypothetical protein
MSGVLDVKDAFQWRVKLGCGCIEERVTLGDYAAWSQQSDVGHRLRRPKQLPPGQFLCAELLLPQQRCLLRNPKYRQVARLGGLCEPFVERRDRAGGGLDGENDAAIGHLQTRGSAQFGKPECRIGGKRQLLDVKRLKRRQNPVQAPTANGRDEDLGQRKRVDCEILVYGLGQQLFCKGMVLVVTVEEGNENARIKDDHAGQSS